MVNPFTNPFRGDELPLGSLLQATAQHLIGELDRALAAAGLPEVRSSHAAPFFVIDPEGNRSTELARRSGVPKQTMGERVRHLERAGYVEVVPDPGDGRARIVRVTGQGWRVVALAAEVIERFDTWLDERVGRDRVPAIRETLGIILREPLATWSPDQDADVAEPSPERRAGPEDAHPAWMSGGRRHLASREEFGGEG